MKKYFSSNLEYVREKRGLSKSELAKKMNVNQSTISRWENNHMGITVENAYDLSIILDIPLPDLVGKDLRNKDIKNSTTKNEQLNLLKEVLKDKGVLEEKEEMSEEDLNRLIDFTKRNKDFIIKNKL